MSSEAKQATSEVENGTSDSVQSSAVTVININPNVVGSGLMYNVYGVGQGTSTPLASGSALNGPVEVSVSGFAQYVVDFGAGPAGCIFTHQTPIISGGKAAVTLAITTTQ
jgi:hypothetical protein